MTSERALLSHSQPWPTLQVAEGVGDGGARGLSLLLEGNPRLHQFQDTDYECQRQDCAVQQITELIS